MKKSYLCCLVSFGMSLAFVLTSRSSAKAASPPPTSDLTMSTKTAAPALCGKDGEGKDIEKVIRPVKLYFTNIDKTASVDGGFMKLLTDIQSSSGLTGVTIAQNERKIFLYGCEDKVKEMSRAIASLDLPRSSINLEMWRLQLSSNNPEELGKVIAEINQEITKTQQLMQKTYAVLEDAARNVKVDKDFKDIMEDGLGYTSALDENRHLSMTDILLRINAAKNPVENATSMSNNIDKIFSDPKSEYAGYINKNSKPFKRYLERVKLPTNCFSSADCEKMYERRVWNARQAVLDFALNYAAYIRKPNEFDPFRLQQAADNLDAVIKPVVEDINRDIADLFIEPTLQKIQAIVRNHRDVQYAQAGKTSVSGLDGLAIDVRSETVSNFNETNPIKLSEILSTVDGQPSIPTAKVLDALIKDRSQSRNFTSGVSLKVTPNVLRNSTSADLDISIVFGPSGADGRPSAAVNETASLGIDGKPSEISRISQQYVNTRINVNTLDLFPISTFNTQSTKDGGRSTIPVIGTVWQGVFGSIPVLGDLFSWKNPPQNVAHQSILLTNSFIVPTAMGLGVLYQQSETDQNKCQAIQDYLTSPNNKPYAQKRMTDKKYCKHFDQEKNALVNTTRNSSFQENSMDLNVDQTNLKSVLQPIDSNLSTPFNIIGQQRS
jgi:hypothetical protein